MLTEYQRSLRRVDARATGCGPRMAPVHQPPIRPGHGQRNAAARVLQRLSCPGLPLPGEWFALTLSMHGALEADSTYNPRYSLPAQTLSQATRPRTCGTSLPCVRILESPSTVAALTKGTREQAAAIVGHIDRETALHLTYCEGFGVSREEMEATEEKQACTAYTRYACTRPPPCEVQDELELTVVPTWPIDTSLISASPRTGLGYRPPLPRACWAMAPWRRCCMETRSLSGKGTITGTGSRTTLPMTTCKQ